MSTKQFDGGLLTGPATDVFVGIDQSYTGFAIAAVSLDGRHHIWVYKSPSTGVERLENIQAFLVRVLDLDLAKRGFKVLDVAMEGYAFTAQLGHMAGELGGMVKMTLSDCFPRHEMGKRPLQVPPTSLKKFVTGRGNAKKQEMLLEVYKRWGVELRDDNAADAFGLAKIASGLAETKAQAEVIDKVESTRDSLT